MTGRTLCSLSSRGYNLGFTLSQGVRKLADVYSDVAVVWVCGGRGVDVRRFLG